VSEQGRWEESDAHWFELRLLYCALCGKVIPRRFWRAEAGAAARIFCDPSCERLYRSYVLTPPAPSG